MKRAFSFIVTVLVLFIVSTASVSRQDATGHLQANDGPAKDLAREQAWVDSVFQKMTFDERLGQLVWVRAHSDLGPEHVAEVERLIKRYHVGGLCFFQGTPEKQAELTNRYQALARRVPLFVSIDAEWGLGMRMKETTLSFPKQMMLGAIQDDYLIYEMGEAVARHLKRIGVNVNFAPVADVNNNAANPVINYRSFGEDIYNVANKAYMYMKGMQDNGVMACAKHFPGHGDTDVDSHYDLPVIPHSLDRLDSLELFPFKILIEQGIGSIMVAHLDVPALDPTGDLPTTLSHPVITDLLKNKLNYNGLIMTDALEMKGVTKHHGAGEVEAKAIAAGNDILLLPSDVDAGFKTMKEWLRTGKLDTTRIDYSTKKILRWKYRMGLTDYTPVDLEGVRADVNDSEAKALRHKLIANALTLARNEDGLIPLRAYGRGPDFPSLKDLESLSLGENMAALAIGTGTGNTFQKTLGLYANIETLATGKDISSGEQAKLMKALAEKDAVIVSVHDMSQHARHSFGITKSTRNFISKLNEQTKVILVLFGNPYSLQYFDEVPNVLVAYEGDDDVESIAAQGLFGAFSLRGKLPVTASKRSRGGMGIQTPSLQRLSYGLPEEVGMDSKALQSIDSLMQEAIDAEATPGGVVLVARKGKVVFHKAYGHHTYGKKARETDEDDIYDLASITKIAATTVSLMKLQEEGKFDPTDPVKKYLPEFAGTDKGDIPITRMLTHRARLTTWIKFYEATLTAKKHPNSKYYQKRKTGKFTLPVAKNLYLREDYPEKIWKEILESPLLPGSGYKYSDLAFYIAGEIIKRQSGMPIEDYVQETFYQPMGMTTTTYRPYEKFALDRIPPTENDKYFRQRRIQGYVHDMGAAMLNQATGHAGLFSDANDLAKLMQMLLNKGSYGGRQYLRPETIHQYATRCNDCTRRGLGFDMLQLDKRYDPNLSPKASEQTFGHLGFTGTAAWVDPASEMVFVFLSNRTYPSMYNKKLGELNTRVTVMDTVYEAMK